MKQTTLWHRTSPTAVAPLLEMPVFKELDTWYTKCWKLYQVLNRVEKKNGQQLQLQFNVLWKNEFKAKAEETFERFKKEVEEEIKKYTNSRFKFRPAPPLRSYFLPLCLPLRPSWDVFPRLNETDESVAVPTPVMHSNCWLGDLPLRIHCRKANSLREDCLELAHTVEGLMEQYKAYTRDAKKKTELRSKLERLEVAQREVVVAFKEANEAEFFSISDKESVALATLLAWQHQAKDIRKHLGRTVTQQLRNMSRDTGPEFYACLSGLKSTTVDWSELHSQLHASLTPSQVHILLETLFCVGHVSLAPYARTVRGQTTLGKLFCAQVPVYCCIVCLH